MRPVLVPEAEAVGSHVFVARVPVIVPAHWVPQGRSIGRSVAHPLPLSVGPYHLWAIGPDVAVELALHGAADVLAQVVQRVGEGVGRGEGVGVGGRVWDGGLGCGGDLEPLEEDVGEAGGGGFGFLGVGFGGGGVGGGLGVLEDPAQIAIYTLQLDNFPWRKSSQESFLLLYELFGLGCAMALGFFLGRDVEESAVDFVAPECSFDAVSLGRVDWPLLGHWQRREP